MQMEYSPEEIRKMISVMKPNNEWFEVRFLADSGKLNYSGYFNSADVLIDEMRKFRPKSNGSFYFTLNKLVDGVENREQMNQFVMNCKQTTSDADICGYDWLMVDLDPIRPSGISSSDEELEKAHQKAKVIFKYLRAQGWSEPVVALSGNGYHLLYNIELQNIQSRQTLVKKTLQALSKLFSDECVDVDVKVFNPSRICKLYGTKATKGKDSEARPHRMARLISFPDTIVPTEPEYLERLVAAELPEAEKPQQYNNYNPSEFNLEEWLHNHNVSVTHKIQTDVGVKFILEECPFNHNHNGKDAAVFQLKNGALSFKCLHNSCSGNGWKEFREHFEPDAYTKKNETRREWEPMPNRFRQVIDNTVEAESEEEKPIFYTTKQIFEFETPNEEFIKTGIKKIDDCMRGLKKGFVTCLSGLRGCGKSSLISQITLEAVEQDYRVALYSGELTPKNLLKWFSLQAAGRNNVYELPQYNGFFSPFPEVAEQVANYYDDKVFIYNNDCGNDFRFIHRSLNECVLNNKVDLIILDNLMTLDISTLDRDLYVRQSHFVGELENFAKSNNVHIIFVAHPRKSNGFLRLDDVSGSNDIVNRVDNALILHRVNEDFKRLTKETLKWKDDNPAYNSTNVIEICKDRDGGNQDVFVSLYFEKESKRLRNDVAEYKHYLWEENPEGLVEF